MTDREILKAIGAVSEKVNEMGKRLDQMARILHDKSASNIDYLALMADVELPSEEAVEVEVPVEGKEVTENEA